MTVVRKIKILTPVLLVLALSILASGAFLQWRLSHVAADPQIVALIGREENLVKSLEASTVGLLNLQDDKPARDRLQEIQVNFESWVHNHRKLVAITDAPGLDKGIISDIKNYVFPRYDDLVAALGEIFVLAEENAAMSLDELRPLVREFEQEANLYMFLLDHFDLRLADLARQKIQSLQAIEGALIIGSGSLLLAALFWLFFPISRILAEYSAKLDDLENAHMQKNEFLAVLGHELRNPLATISGGVQVMRNAPEQSSKMLPIMERSIRLVTSLLDDLLDLSRMARGEIKLHKETFDLRRAIEDVVSEMRATIKEKDQDLVVNLPSQPLWVNADPVRIEQIVTNLLSNAHKYTLKGGRIRLAAVAANDEARITVTDNGTGIAPDHLEEIFEPFVRSEKAVSTPGSLGIGLALVKRLAEKHGGKVAAYSDGEGQGAEFTVSLPLTQAPAEAGIKPEQAKQADLPPGAVKGMRVMLVDDNPETLTGTEAVLKEQGCLIEEATSAKEAIEGAESFKADVFLLDIGMPDMNGYDLCRYLRKHGYQNALVIAISGYGHEEAHRLSEEAGMDYHLNKPVDYRELLQKMAAYRKDGPPRARHSYH